MTSLDATDLTVFIAREGNELVTDSRAVAIAFGKQHRNVLRTIREMRANAHSEIAAHALLNFEQCSYVSAQGNAQPMYRMTADGLAELAMGSAEMPPCAGHAGLIAFQTQLCRALNSSAGSGPEIKGLC